MMINKTTEYWNYRQSLHTGPERAPRFLRRDTATGKGADIVDISEAARKRMLEKNSTPLVKAIMSFSREIGEMVRMAEAEADGSRRTRIEELRLQVREGSYDFEGSDKMEPAADSLMTGIKPRHNSQDCA